MTTAAEAIAARLAAAGVRHAFGIPGGEVLALIDALDRAGIRFVTARHETAAGFMAEGAHHATGAPAVLVATVGPGVSNAVNVVANAQQDRVPLIVLTGAIDPDERLTYTHQVFDHQAVLRPLTKASIAVAAGSADLAIERAIQLATAHPRGPVHLDLPISVARAPERGAPAPAVPIRTRAVDVDDLPARLARAERPLVVAGLESIDHATAVRELAERLGAPVLTTYKAKGVVDERDPRALGGVGLSPRADAIALPLVRRADVVVLAGYDPIEMRRGWRDPFARDALVIDVAETPPSHGVHRASIALVGDVGATLRALARDLVPARRWPDREPELARRALRDAFAPEPGGWGPLAIAHAVRAAIPDDAFVTVDTGAHRIAIDQALESRRPHRLLQSTGLCTMGCALPLAIGVSLACDRTPVVALTGDGGLDMVLGELATARDLAVPVIVVVIDDRSLGLIEMKQRHEGLPSVGVALGSTDYVAVARALGGRAELATDAATLRAAVEGALAARDRFTLVHCPIPERAYDGVI